MILAMLSSVDFLIRHFAIIVLVLCGCVLSVIAIVRQPANPKKAANWPETEATIQSVGTVRVSAGRNSYSLDIGDFSYVFNDNYYSGRLKLSPTFSTHDAQPRKLVGRKFHVRYNPRKPERYYVPQQEVATFLLDPYDEPFGEDVGPVELNLDKI